MHNMNQKIENICILRISSLGDICHMLPFINTLKKNYPNAKITWIIGKNEADFLGKINGIEFIIFDKSNTWKSYIGITNKLCRIKFDILFIMQVSLRANIISLLIKSKIKLGYDKKRSSDLHSLFSNKKIKNQQHSHVVDVFLSFLNILNIDKENYIYKWKLNEKVSKEDLYEKFPYLKEKYFLLSPCSRSSNRNWLVDRYIKSADYICEKYGLQCVISSSSDKKEKDFVKKIANNMKVKPYNLSGKTDLHYLLSLIRHSELLISPDSGPIHMATCVDTSVIGLYGVTNIVRAGPYNSRNLCIDKYQEALKKYSGLKFEQAPWRYKNNHPDVMKLISVTDVIEKIDRYFFEENKI